MNFLSYTVVEISLTKNVERKKIDKYKEEKIGESRFSIPRYILSLSTCVPNMNSLSLMVLEISLTKKCYGITDGRTGGRTDRCKPVHPHFFEAGV